MLTLLCASACFRCAVKSWSRVLCYLHAGLGTTSPAIKSGSLYLSFTNGVLIKITFDFGFELGEFLVQWYKLNGPVSICILQRAFSAWLCVYIASCSSCSSVHTIEMQLRSPTYDLGGTNRMTAQWSDSFYVFEGARSSKIARGGDW